MKAIKAIRNVMFAASAALTLVMFILTIAICTSTGELNNEQDQWFVYIGQTWLATLFLSLILGIVEDLVSQKTSDIKNKPITNLPIEGWYNNIHGSFHLTFDGKYYTLHHEELGIISDYMSEEEAKSVCIIDCKKRTKATRLAYGSPSSRRWELKKNNAYSE